MLEGKVTEILGHMDDPGVDILSILRAYNLPQEFPEEVMKQVRKIPQEIRVSEEILKFREDFRDVPTVTIDGPDTKDIDEAISIRRLARREAERRRGSLAFILRMFPSMFLRTLHWIRRP